MYCIDLFVAFLSTCFKDSLALVSRLSPKQKLNLSSELEDVGPVEERWFSRRHRWILKIQLFVHKLKGPTQSKPVARPPDYIVNVPVWIITVSIYFSWLHESKHVFSQHKNDNSYWKPSNWIYIEYVSLFSRSLFYRHEKVTFCFTANLHVEQHQRWKSSRFWQLSIRYVAVLQVSWSCHWHCKIHCKWR